MPAENEGHSSDSEPVKDQPTRVPKPPMESNSLPLIGNGCAVVLAGGALLIVLVVRLV